MKLDHLAIAVADLDAALTFYRDALGLELDGIEAVEREGVRIAFLPLGDGQSRIELVQPTRDDTGIAKWMAKRGPGMHHVCLAVPNLESALARLVAHGCELINPQPVMREDGTPYAFVHPRSAFGVLVELYEKPE
ncbi:MAG: methylmalonyl-CoA epimerase [Candidatus Roseilinea sp.]|nr:MAG: methylmalonyl-CoA epimerase [Candidatus Roseilinea sp.]